MRKIIAVTFPFAVLATAMVIFMMLESQRPPNWQLELNQYFELTTPPPETVTMQAVVPARRPQNFSPEMAFAVLTGSTWGGIDIPPPNEIKCVLLERTRRDGETGGKIHWRQLVLVAYHSDHLWHQGWIVHEAGDLSEPTSIKILTMLGCEFESRYLDDLARQRHLFDEGGRVHFVGPYGNKSTSPYFVLN